MKPDDRVYLRTLANVFAERIAESRELGEQNVLISVVALEQIVESLKRRAKEPK